MIKKHKTKLARNIAKMRGLAGLNQTELAERLEVGTRTVAAWECGERVPKTGVLEQIARVCHDMNPETQKLHGLVTQPTPDEQWDISIADSPSDATESTISDKGMPGYEQKEETVSMAIHAFAGAGGPIELFEHEPIRIVDIPKRWKKPNINGILVRGRSMEPTIMNGAVIGIDTEEKRIVSGEMYAIWLDHEGAVVKRLFADPDHVRIVSDNPQFKDVLVRHENVGDLVMGKLKWVMQSY